MREDPLLNALGRAAREDEAAAGLDARWDQLAAGTASAEEIAELRALAERSPEAREIFEAFRPLGPAFEARVVAAAKRELPQPRPRLLPFRRPAAPLWVSLGAASAVAASLLLFFRPLVMRPLPLYMAELSAGDQELRGSEHQPGELPSFSPGSLLTLRLEPEEAPDGEVEVRCCFFLRGAEVVRWRAKVEQGAAGVVRVRGALGKDFALSPGDWTVWVVVGRSGKIPREAELVAALRAGSVEQKSWRAESKHLRVEETLGP